MENFEKDSESLKNRAEQLIKQYEKSHWLLDPAISGERADELRELYKESAREKFLSMEQQVGIAIRIQRVRSGLSQVELADRLNASGMPLNQTQVAKLETGKRPIRLAELFAIGEVLSIPVNIFLNDGAFLGALSNESHIEELRADLERYEKKLNYEVSSLVETLERFGKSYSADVAEIARTEAAIAELSASTIKAVKAGNKDESTA